MVIEIIAASFIGSTNSCIKCKCYILYIIWYTEVIYRYLMVRSILKVLVSFIGSIRSYITCTCHKLYVISYKEVIYGYVKLDSVLKLLRLVFSVV